MAIKDMRKIVGKTIKGVRMDYKVQLVIKNTTAAAVTARITKIECAPGSALKNIGHPRRSSGTATGTSNRRRSRRRRQQYLKPYLSQTNRLTFKHHHFRREVTKQPHDSRRATCAYTRSRTVKREKSPLANHRGCGASTNAGRSAEHSVVNKSFFQLPCHANATTKKKPGRDELVTTVTDVTREDEYVARHCKTIYADGADPFVIAKVHEIDNTPSQPHRTPQAELNPPPFSDVCFTTKQTTADSSSISHDHLEVPVTQPATIQSRKSRWP